MKLLKKIGIVLAVLLILFVAAIFLVPQKFYAEVVEDIDARPQTVFNIINNLTLTPSWNPWQAQDTSMVLTYGDVISGEGASYSWKSKEMGDGSTKYTSVEKNSKIVSDIEFGGMGQGEATFTLIPDGTKGTTLTWALDSKTSRPWNLINFLIKRSTKQSFRDGIAKLEILAQQREKQGLYRGYQLKEELLTGRSYIINRDEVGIDKIALFYAQNLAPLFQKIQDANVEMQGHPSGLVYNYDMEKGTVDMAAGIPIAQDVNIKDASLETFDTKKAIVIDYYGDPQYSETAHAAMDEYFADRDMSFDYPVIEEYVTDPSEESNPEKWLTKIIYYISE